jgi:hypothetical protein
MDTRRRKMETRFNAKQSTIVKELVSVMKKMNASNLKIEQGNLLDDGDVKAKIVFDRSGKRYIFECDNYTNKKDNLRAAQLAISYLYRALESYGVLQESSTYDMILDNFLLGFEATPDDDVLKLPSSTEWYEILGVKKDAKTYEIKNAYKAMAKIYHPDNGGSTEQFVRLKNALEKAMGEKK